MTSCHYFSNAICPTSVPQDSEPKTITATGVYENRGFDATQQGLTGTTINVTDIAVAEPSPPKYGYVSIAKMCYNLRENTS